MTGFGVGGGGRHVQDRLDNAEGDTILLLERRVLDAVGFKRMCETSVYSGVGLGIWWLSRVGEAI